MLQFRCSWRRRTDSCSTPGRSSSDGSTLQFDVVCIYTGDAGAERYWACLDEHAGAVEDAWSYCLYSEGFFVVNNNTRTRAVPIAAGLVEEMDSMCPFDEYYGYGSEFYLSVIAIRDGRVEYMRHECPHS